MWKLLTLIFAIRLFTISGRDIPFTEDEASDNNNTKTEKLLVCYLNRESVYRPGLGIFDIDDIEADQCTHLIYGFASVDEQTSSLVASDPAMDLEEDNGRKGFSRATQLKKSHADLKVLLAVKSSSEVFSALAANETTRQAFTKQSSEFLREHEFDGLDINWHYPANRGGKPEDRENFMKLVVDLKNEYKEHGLLLTAPVEASKDIIDSAYDIQNLSDELDYLFVMAYDMGGAWDRRIIPNAPLNVETGSKSIKFIIDYLIFKGAPAEKLILGLPLYGRTFITELEGRMNDPANPVGFKGPYTDKNGFLGYNEICTSLAHPSFNWTYEWNEQGAEMLARYRDPITKFMHVVVYDTQRSMANKVRFAIRNGLAGVMAWSLDTDDFKGECTEDDEIYTDFGTYPGMELEKPEPPKGKFPLLKAAKQAIEVAEQELKLEKELKDEEEKIRNWSVKEDKPVVRSDATTSLIAIFTILPVALAHFLTL